MQTELERQLEADAMARRRAELTAQGLDEAQVAQQVEAERRAGKFTTSEREFYEGIRRSQAAEQAKQRTSPEVPATPAVIHLGA